MAGVDGRDMKGWLINGRTFDPQRTDATVRLSEVEVWRITTNFNHPVHVHLNQFQILTRNRHAPPPTDRGWSRRRNPPQRWTSDSRSLPRPARRALPTRSAHRARRSDHHRNP